jgi:hypothetical protein
MVLTLLLLHVALVNAQEFSGGILLGVCASQIDGDDQFKYKKPGLVFGAYVKRPFSEKFSLKIETYYVGKGAVKNNELPDGTVEQIFNTSLHYVEMAFLPDYQVFPKLNISLGFAPSYLFAHKLTSLKTTVPEDLYTMKIFDFQPVLHIGFYLTDHISTDLRLAYSAFNIRKDALAIWYNNNLSIVFRYKI